MSFIYSQFQKEIAYQDEISNHIVKSLFISMCSRVGGGRWLYKVRAHVKLTKGQRDLAFIHRAVFK